jgi:glycine/D-amino acid oxidase-like deaminating enzyme
MPYNRDTCAELVPSPRVVMKTRYGVSPWVHQFPESRRPDYPRLKGDLAVDVVILGAGLTGCATAWACASAGLKTVVLEADRVGAGASGRSAGLLLPEPGPMFRDVVQAHGLRAARQVFGAWRRASLDAAATLKRLNIRCGLQPIVSVTSATAGETGRVLRREHDARESAGIPVSWLTSAQLKAATNRDDSEGGMKSRDAFSLDPYRACVGMAAAATARKAKIYERTRALKAKFTRKDAEVSTADSVIRTSAVVVTTGLATREYRQLQRHFTDRESYLVLTEPLAAAVRKQLVAPDLTIRDMHVPRRRLRWTADYRVLIGGADQDRPADRVRDAVRIQRTGQLMYELLTMYPAISGLQPEYGWELAYGDTADGLMYIGPHRNYPHHLFALGGATDSITGAFLAARIATRSLQGASDKGDEVFGFTR